jgi:ADP-ribosylglycohydrolase
MHSTDRVAGGLLGVHAGDALGATVEFSGWAAIRARYPDGVREIVGGGPFDWPPGHATDDTDLTRAVLQAYLRPGGDVVRAAADRMLAWMRGDWPGRQPGSRPRDIGGATSDGLDRYARTGDPRAAGAGAGRAGNGSLMRCLPTALAVAEPERRIRESMEISAITHDDPRCTVACAAYNEIAAALLGGAAPGDAVTAGHVTAGRLGERTVADAIAFGRQLDPAAVAATGQTYLADNAAGFVLDSLSLAVAAVLDPRPFPDVVVDIVRAGNDTDTNGAIAGGLLGVRDGAAAIPGRWVATLQFAAEFTAAAEQLAGRADG